MLDSGGPFPAHKSAVLGQVKVLMGFRNYGDVAYNLTLISGSLNVPGSFSQYIQNLTTLVRDAGPRRGTPRKCRH